MRPERIARMPDWPARMDDDMAADYLGVSVSAFRDKVKARQYPQPICEGVKKLWSRVQLDRFIAAQFDLPVVDPTPSQGATPGSWDM
jgi:hypothetical protein